MAWIDPVHDPPKKSSTLRHQYKFLFVITLPCKLLFTAILAGKFLFAYDPSSQTPFLPMILPRKFLFAYNPSLQTPFYCDPCRQIPFCLRSFVATSFLPMNLSRKFLFAYKPPLQTPFTCDPSSQTPFCLQTSLANSLLPAILLRKFLFAYDSSLVVLCVCAALKIVMVCKGDANFSKKYNLKNMLLKFKNY